MEKISIKRARLNFNIKQKDIADKLNMKQSTYSLYENGIYKFHINDAIKFAEIVGLSVYDIRFA